MKSFKTPKGTELTLLDLRGKDYLEVKYRLVWFREVHPLWAIETELVSSSEKATLAKATIKDESGRIIATAHKYEDKQGFADHTEKAETSAIGRALALIGFGTQFCADELDEGSRIVDAPVNRSNLPEVFPEQPGFGNGSQVETGYRVDFGKWNMRSLEQIYNDVGPEPIMNYIKYIEDSAVKKGEKPNSKAQKFIDEASNFLGVMENSHS